MTTHSNTSPNVVHFEDAKILNAIGIRDSHHFQKSHHPEDRYNRRLEIDGSPYLVSFLPFFQKIIFTELNGKEAGEFTVKNGWIAAKQPADFILKNEIIQYLEAARTRLTKRNF